MKISNLIMFLLLVSSIYIGLNQLSYNKEIFADVNAYCCDDGVCDEQQCNGSSSMYLKSNCSSEYEYDCTRCLEEIANNNLCNYTGETIIYCDKSDGTKFWANYSLGATSTFHSINNPTRNGVTLGVPSYVGTFAIQLTVEQYCNENGYFEYESYQTSSTSGVVTWYNNGWHTTGSGSVYEITLIEGYKWSSL